MCTTDMRRGSPQKGNEWQFAYSQDVRCKSRYCHSKILLSLRLKPCELFAAYFGPSQFWFVLSPLSSSPSQSFKASKHKVFRFLSWRFPRCCPCVCGALTSQGRTAIQETILAQRCLCMILLRRILLALDSSSSPLKLRERPLINPWLFPAPWISTQIAAHEVLSLAAAFASGILNYQAWQGVTQTAPWVHTKHSKERLKTLFHPDARFTNVSNVYSCWGLRLPAAGPVLDLPAAAGGIGHG